MNIPSAPLPAGHTVSGKVSWFGGPQDSTDSGHTASGGTTATPGIAVYNRATLGGYWKVTDQKTGRSVVLKQTDLGPAPFTGRKIDVTYSALNRFGYNENNFPTDSDFSATYLGSNPKGAATVSTAPVPVSAPIAKATPSRQVSSSVDQAAFKKAQGLAMLGRLLSSEKGSSENPLLATGLIPTKEPEAQNFMKSTRIPGVPASTGSSGTIAASGASLSGGPSIPAVRGATTPLVAAKGGFAPSPSKAAEVVTRQADSKRQLANEVVALNKKLAGRNEHLPRATLKKIVDGSTSPKRLEAELKLNAPAPKTAAPSKSAFGEIPKEALKAKAAGTVVAVHGDHPVVKLDSGQTVFMRHAKTAHKIGDRYEEGT